MQGVFKAQQITEHVYWVGAVDWSLRDFHGYLTSRGTTYNAYLILADKVTLIDTVKAPFHEEMMSRIASIVDPSEIQVIVSNHAEMDHSGCLPRVIEAVQPEHVYASVQGVAALAAHFDLPAPVEAVPDGGTIDLGNMDLTVVETRLLHWPDSMFTYLARDAVLFTQDAFGMHLASSERFDDEVAWETLHYEAAKYYANILLPYAPLITKLLERVSGMELDVKYLATDHGPIWRKDIGRILGLYGSWSDQARTNKAVIVYDTMWGSTGKMAQAIGEGLLAGGARPKLMNLAASHRSDIATEVLDAGALIVGSPTLNSMMFPSVADVLNYLKGLKRRNLIGAAFGSYGWGGQGIDQVQAGLTEMKVDLVADPVKVKYVPKDEDLARCVALGARLAELLKERCRNEVLGV